MEWRTVVGYENYEASNTGLIRNATTKEVKSQRIDSHGYCVVGAYKDGKKHKAFVHRMVALAFIPTEIGKPCVNHKDENKTNNSVENLEWCDIWYNNHYGTRQQRCDDGRSKAIAAYKDGVLVKEFKSQLAAAKELGVNVRSIHRALKHQGQHRCAGFEWKYVSQAPYKKGGGGYENPKPEKF